METKSYFIRKLESNQDLATKCGSVAKSLHEALDDDIKATRKSEQLTAEDLSIYINTRADSY